MTEAVVLKLEQAFAIDATVEEACSYAEISRNTFYEYLKKNPEFQDRIDDLRQRPVLKARQTIVGALGNPDVAFKYIERKRKHEFSTRIEQDITSNGETIDATDTTVKELSEKFDEFFKAHTAEG